MKVFDLVCGAGHRFEGWFASAERYAEQADAGAVRCPACDSSAIHREPSAPRLNLGGDPIAAPASRTTPTSMPGASSNGDPLTVVRRLLAQTEDVGPRFAEEARRIHYDEVPPRAIRGTATEREREALRDEGIDTLSLPIPRALTETLQ